MSQWKVLPGLLVLPLLLAGWSAAGQEAGPKKILVLNPESRVLDPGKLHTLGNHLRSLIRRYPSLEVKEIPSLQFKVMKRKARCKGAETECLVGIGKQVGVSRVLHSEVQTLPGRYLTVMKLVDVEAGQLLETSRQRAHRRIDSVRSALLKGWVDLFGPLIRSQLQVSANVGGADVFLDGRNIGKTPLVLTKDLGKGTHIVTVTRPGYLPVRNEIRVGQGRKLKVSVTLEKESTEVAAKVPVMGKKVDVKEEPEPAEPPPPPPPPPKVPVMGKKVVDKKVGGEEKPEPAEPPLPPPPPPPVPGDKVAEPKLVERKAAARRPVVRKPVERKVSEKREESKPGDLPEKKPESREFLPSFGGVGGVEEKKPDEDLRISESRPLYEQWWFWTAIGVVVAGGVVGLVFGLSAEEEGIPSGKGRVVIEF